MGVRWVDCGPIEGIIQFKQKIGGEGGRGPGRGV